MTHLKGFTSSLEELPEVNATIERWMYGTNEMERRMCERIVSLCRYYDRIPEESLAGYGDVLFEVLDDDKLESGFLKSEHLDRSIRDFVNHLKSSGDPAKRKKADLILAKVREKFQIDD